MDHKIIFEEYTKASNKMKYVKDKAKALEVYDSDIVCELLKSGYKFEELKRANKGTYNAGMKKYEKWKENGSPEDEDADALERTEPEQSEPAPSTRVDALEKELNKADAALKEERVRHSKREMELCGQLGDKIEEIEKLNHEKCRLETENRKLNIKVQELLERSEPVPESTDAEEEIAELKRAFDEMTQNYNSAMLMTKRLEEQLALEKADNESECRNLKLAYRENEELRTKIQKCEAFIINQMVYLDFTDFGLKHKENGNNM